MIVIRNKIFLLKTKIYSLIILELEKLIKHLKYRIFSKDLRIILNYNYLLNQRDMRFVIVGANDGLRFDFINSFINTNSYGLMIEPISNRFLELERNFIGYKNVKPINKAVHPNFKTVSMYSVSEDRLTKYPDWSIGISSLYKDHLIKLGVNEDDIFESVVECDSLMKIIQDNLLDLQIDYLQIDTEGYDYEVIKMIDFDTIKPHIIKFEHCNLKQQDIKAAEVLLKRQGYLIFKQDNDSICVDIRKIRIL